MSNKYKDFDILDDNQDTVTNNNNGKGDNMNNNDKDFELQEIKNLLGNMATSDMEFRVNMQTVIGDLARDQKADREELRRFQQEARNHWNNEKVDHAQKLGLNRAVHNRVCMLLKVPSKKKDRSYDEESRFLDHVRLFSKRCRFEVSCLGHLCIPQDDTKAINYDEAVREIYAWVPSNGVSGLMMEQDELNQFKQEAG